MKTRSIYIYGASGHGGVVADIARESGYDEIIFLDDAKGVKFEPNLTKFPVIIAIGDNQIRANLMQKVADFGFEIATLIHPRATISNSAKIGVGSVVMAGAIINANAQIGASAIINSGAIIEHDCVIGEFAHISPGAALAGGVSVGAFSHVGIGARVIQLVKIGVNCTIGGGAVVIRNLDDNAVAVGVPARVIKFKEALNLDRL